MILIAFGSNLPFLRRSPAEIVASAASALSAVAPVRRLSLLRRSPAWPDPTYPEFVNAAAVVETSLGAEALLAALHAIEAGFGRRRSLPNAPRTLDLDLIAYGELVVDPGEKAGPVLPHPRAAARRFVLEPIAEIAPGWRHPQLGRTAAELLADLDRA